MFRYRDGAELKQSVKYMKRYQEDDYYFILNRCKTEDRGEYVIRADNSYGFREEPVFLNVQGKFCLRRDINFCIMILPLLVYHFYFENIFNETDYQLC